MVEVHVLGPLDKPDGKSVFKRELADGVTVSDLLSALGYKDDHARFISVLVNDAKGEQGTVLRDGDRVYLSLLVGGG